MYTSQTEIASRVDEITTDWEIVRDPPRFVLRYAPAIQGYVRVLIKDRHDAEEVAQDFFLRVTQKCFAHTRKEGGRFRDYLKTAVRNAALSFLNRHRGSKPLHSSSPQIPAGAEHVWLAEWRRCLLDRAWLALEKHQRQAPGNLFHTVLTMMVENPRDDANTLAARTSRLIGRPLRAEAFRKQVSRARCMLAKLLFDEVARTLHNPTPKQIEEELRELALWEYVRRYLALSRR
jgi:Sigma-70 region 2